MTTDASKRLFYFFAGLVLILVAITYLEPLPLNTSTPAYIKQVVAYKEGDDGLMIYFILADETGAMTTADGTVRYEIFERDNDGTLLKLYTWRFDAAASSFVKTTVGHGAFERTVVLFPMGRIPYSSLWRAPEKYSGEVHITFTPNARRALTGKTAIIFE